MTSCYLGVDIGSVSTNLVLMNENCEIIHKLYLRTAGQPIKVLLKGLNMIKENYGKKVAIIGVGTTGSGRNLASVIMGADEVKNEITAHAVAADKLIPGVKTILEIGGQDSKIIILRDGFVYDFAMNTVCAAGTGSFLDRQASRLGIPIEEFGYVALKSKSTVRIAGRCAVFAESDMIHKQQTGHSIEDIANGLCEALVRNYLNNLAKGKELDSPIVFQGGVAANIGIVEAFKKALGKDIIIPEYHDVMGAYGAAIIAREKVKNQHRTNFKGFELTNKEYSTKSMECSDCSNACEVIKITSEDDILACWGDKCGKWEASNAIDNLQMTIAN